MTETKPHTKAAHQEATNWVVSLHFASERDNELDALLPQFERWLDAEPGNRGAFASVQSHWDTLEMLDDRGRWGIDDLVESVGSAEQVGWYRFWSPGWGWALGVTLLAFLILGLGALLHYSPGVRSACPAPFKMTHGQCALGEGRQASSMPTQLVLTDGTRVSYLGELIVSLTSEHRRVYLQRGEASFNVSKQERPFWVSLGNAWVKAVGTEFSVKRIGATISTTRVTEGKVEIFVADQHGFVQAGEVGEFDGFKLTVHPTGHTRAFVDPDGQRMLQFQHAPLGEAVWEFNRYNPRAILTVDDQIAQQLIGGFFVATDPDGFAAVVDATFGFKHIISNDPVRGIKLIRLSGKLRDNKSLNIRQLSGGT